MTARASETPARARGPRLELDAWGVVFCGGQSRRMGRDKALIVLGGATLIERATRVLLELTPRVLLACGPTPRYPELGFECVLDGAPDLGPLGGLEAALARMEAAGGRYVVAVACDMPRVTAEVLRRLLACARAEAAGVTLVASGGREEPLCAVYDVAVLPAVRRALAAGERRMIAFHGEVRVLRVPEAELAPGCARNLNTPAELAAFDEEGP
ncbi:MAG TPA: molybdenum cofactor guanylyltransferase [Planctomycetota bacterium]